MKGWQRDEGEEEDESRGVNKKDLVLLIVLETSCEVEFLVTCQERLKFSPE